LLRSDDERGRVAARRRCGTGPAWSELGVESAQEISVRVVAQRTVTWTEIDLGGAEPLPVPGGLERCAQRSLVPLDVDLVLGIGHELDARERPGSGISLENAETLRVEGRAGDVRDAERGLHRRMHQPAR